MNKYLYMRRTRNTSHIVAWLSHSSLIKISGVVSFQKYGDHQALINYGHIIFHVTSHPCFGHAHSRELLFLGTLCITKWDHNSCFDQYKLLESGGHGHQVNNVNKPLLGTKTKFYAHITVVYKVLGSNPKGFG